MTACNASIRMEDTRIHTEDDQERGNELLRSACSVANRRIRFFTVELLSLSLSLLTYHIKYTIKNNLER